MFKLFAVVFAALMALAFAAPKPEPGLVAAAPAIAYSAPLTYNAPLTYSAPYAYSAYAAPSLYASRPVYPGYGAIVY